MKVRTLLFLAGIILLLSGCNSTSQSQDDADLANNAGYRCEQTRSLGSHIPTTYCSSALDRKLAKEAAADELRSIQASRPTVDLETGKHR
ncbi:hypothetical protein C3B51_00975 [Pseudoalteromonas rubra]|uniref:Lipoprotein n=1 Tax=Pseudoalteromonas rubra TaxID=43658 RepID=A0A4Q7ESK0_9GAMM|nr:hypothetical protein [Pseudoalteromonas rubra]RZM85253.1 hypothetical protein C3B51_00975 [Pseudoalteromonas rubra]